MQQVAAADALVTLLRDQLVTPTDPNDDAIRPTARRLLALTLNLRSAEPEHAPALWDELARLLARLADAQADATKPPPPIAREQIDAAEAGLFDAREALEEIELAIAIGK